MTLCQFVRNSSVTFVAIICLAVAVCTPIGGEYLKGAGPEWCRTCEWAEDRSGNPITDSDGNPVKEVQMAWGLALSVSILTVAAGVSSAALFIVAGTMWVEPQ